MPPSLFLCIKMKKNTHPRWWWQLPVAIEDRRTRHCLRLTIAWKLQDMDMLATSYDALHNLPKKSMTELLYCFLAAPHLGKWADVIALGDELVKMKPEVAPGAPEQQPQPPPELMNIIYHCSWQMPFECRYPNYAAIYEIVKQLQATTDGKELLAAVQTRMVTADFSVTKFMLKFDRINSKDKKYKLTQMKDYPREPQQIRVSLPIHRVGAVVTWQGVINAIPVAGIILNDHMYLLGHVNTQDDKLVMQVDEEFVLRRSADPFKTHVWQGFAQWKKTKTSGSGPVPFLFSLAHCLVWL